MRRHTRTLGGERRVDRATPGFGFGPRAKGRLDALVKGAEIDARQQFLASATPFFLERGVRFHGSPEEQLAAVREEVAIRLDSRTTHAADQAVLARDFVAPVPTSAHRSKPSKGPK